MDATCQIPVNSNALAALRDYLRDSGSDLSLCAAATLALRAWLAAENDRDLAAAGYPSASPPESSPEPEPLPRSEPPKPAEPAESAESAESAELPEPSEPREPPSSPESHEISAAPAAPAAPGTSVPSGRPEPLPRGRPFGPLRATRQSQGGAGYQWKEVFLPDGTELRMQCDGGVHRARVTGDAIVYQGRRLSPRQFTLAVAGDGRNAWRDLSLRLPGQTHFRPAALHRHNARAQMRMNAEDSAGMAGPQSRAGRRESPADTIAAAAQAMSEALRTALALVEHSNAQALPKYERRVDFHRRASDVVADHVKFD